MITCGLCCLFVGEPVKFRTLTCNSIRRTMREEQLAKISQVCLHNSRTLVDALVAADRLDIRAFRISSQLFPLFTHPECGYTPGMLPDCDAILSAMSEAAEFAKKKSIRLSFHPDQFVIPASPKPEVAAASIRELEYHNTLADLVGAEEINIHMGGVYGDKSVVLERFKNVFRTLPESLRTKLTLENDDISYTPSDLIPVCRELGIPFVYDVHHHRCNPDGMSEDKATALCAGTWEKRGKTPHFHISSPKNGCDAGNPRPHADFINPADFPECWFGLDAVADIEAKAKEKAIIRLRGDMSRLIR